MFCEESRRFLSLLEEAVEKLKMPLPGRPAEAGAYIE